MTKKILFVSNTDLHINLCYIPYMKYLKEQGYIVHVATDTDIIFEYCDKKIQIPITRKPFKIKNILAVFKLRKIINKENYDLISTSTPMGSVVARLAFKKNSNTKLLYTAHGFHFYNGCPIINKIIYYPIEKKLMKKVDVLVTINNEDYLFAKRHFKTDVRYIKGIGFDNEKFNTNLSLKEKTKLRKNLGLKNEDYIITYVAELSKRKRQIYLINTLSKMDLANIKVLLIGNNLLKNKIKKIIVKRNLDDKIKMLGFRRDISGLLDISDLVISVSKQEGLPLNILEAMKKEKPIIVTDCRGNRDLIKNNINGIVVPMKNEKELINKIYYLKNNKVVANELGKANKKLVIEYSIDKILPQYTKIYEELI